MFKKLGRGWLAILCSIVLLGAGAVIVTPAANALSGGINWSKVFKHQIKPRADKRYYTKKVANKKFAPTPQQIRGTFDVSGYAGSGSVYLTSSISFGVKLKQIPTINYIHSGDTPPPVCPGTVTSPKAKAGHLCVFEETTVNTAATGTYDPTTPSALFTSANRIGITVYGLSNAAGQVFSFGTWALGTGKFTSSRSGTHASGPGAVR